VTACDRFESEGLARFVAGQTLDAHFENCPDCRAARASYQAVALALQQAREAYAPAGNWEAKVWARIQRRQRARPWPFFGFAATIAALALFFVSSMAGPDALSLSTTLVERGSSAPVVRGGASRGGDVRSGVPGAVLFMGVKVPRGKQGEIRVYRGPNELVFQCAKSPACIRVKDGLEAHVTLDRPGIYRAVGIAADTQLPATTGSLDADYAAARRSGTATESAPFEIL